MRFVLIPAFPAYLNVRSTNLYDRAQVARSEDAAALVEANPELFDRSLAPSVLQSLCVLDRADVMGAGDNRTPNEAQAQALQHIDGEALKALLR